ncbi:MAG: immune inhibitor A [Anaerolineae bacterium]|nr:immune inhibitor A [Anaerolineae bacterium]
MIFFNRRSSKIQQTRRPDQERPGQALVEYALIIALIIIGLIVVIAAIGPAIGNIFSNTVVNVLEAPEPRETLAPEQFWNTVTAVWLYTPEGHAFATWTPGVATYTPSPGPTTTPPPTGVPPTDTLEPTPGPSLTPTEAVFTVPFGDNVEALNSRDRFQPDDTGNCKWAVASEHFASASNAWSDSPGLQYLNGSDCKLRLRGVLDLTSASAPIELTFMNRWHLNMFDWATVEVSTNNGATWTNITTGSSGYLHYNSSNLAFVQETVDLSAYAGQQIMLRFRLNATSHPYTGDGWWIDDIRIREANLIIHPFPFRDDVDGGGSCPDPEACWIPSGTWARSTEAAHASPYAWSDSPGGNYIHGSNTSLTLDGYVEIPESAIKPALIFWNRWSLKALDHAYAEISTETNPNWVILLDHFNNANLAWTRQVLPLDGYQGEKVRIRFRLDATQLTAVGNGWWVDDISVEELNVPVVNVLPWRDDMESSSLWWIPEGEWALASEYYYSTDTAWSDSPGRNYTHGTDSALTINAIFDLAAVGIPNPELVFWDRYNLGSGDKAHVEISTDEGQSWTSIYNHYNETNTSWSRHALDLSGYAAQRVMIRFRLDATQLTAVGNGWWIDDVEIRERPPEVIITLPWCEDFELGTTAQCSDTRYTGDKWQADGTWTLGNEAPPAAPTCHSGDNCWSDSPHTSYQHGTNAAITLQAKIDLSGTTNPVLFYWQATSLRAGDSGIVEVSTDNGNTWKRADTSHSTYKMFEVTNLAWTRNQISLSSYIGQRVMLRFRLEAIDNTQTGDGWWIDDLQILDYSPRVYTLPFLDEAEPGYFENWIADGTWGLTTEHACDQGGCTPSVYSYTDSPGANYVHGTKTWLTLNGVIQLPAGAEALMTLWRKRALVQNEDYLDVEISLDGGYTWINKYHYSRASESWSSYIVDMTSYAGQVITIRFGVDATSGLDVSDGAYIDRIEIAD